MNKLIKNIKIFVDPFETTNFDHWLFKDGESISMKMLQQLLDKKKNCLLHFNRRSFLRCAALHWRFKSRKNIVTRKVYFKNDGLFTSVFESKNSWAYSAFRKAHLPEKIELKKKILNCSPLALRADGCFLLVANNDAFGENLSAMVPPEIKQLNFMFYSNSDGKLLLVDGKTFLTGSGIVVKTTANRQYLTILTKEFETLKLIHEYSKKYGITPVPIKHIYGERNEYFIENYIEGQSLREVLRAKQTCTNKNLVCSLVDKLDDWFNIYIKGFSGRKKSFQQLYQPLFTSLRLVYSDNYEIILLVEKIWSVLAKLDQKHPGLTPVIAHNDLWPGNFVLASDRLVAVDWERATSDRSEFFDYFWLLISAVLEYRVGLTSAQDYAAGFRSYLYENDTVCKHARDKITTRLEHNGIPQDLTNLFYCLFLVEWSIQGWLVLKRQTDMDKLALGELLCFIKVVDCFEFSK